MASKEADAVDDLSAGTVEADITPEAPEAAATQPRQRSRNPAMRAAIALASLPEAAPVLARLAYAYGVGPPPHDVPAAAPASSAIANSHYAGYRSKLNRFTKDTSVCFLTPMVILMMPCK